MKTVEQFIEELRKYPGNTLIVVPKKPGQPKIGGGRDLVDPILKDTTDPTLNDTMATNKGGVLGAMVRVIVIEAD